MNVVVIILNVGLIGILLLQAKKWFPTSLRKFFWPAFSVKVLSALLLGWLYSDYYATGDTWHFFSDGKVIANLARNDVAAFLQLLTVNADSWSSLPGFTLTDPRALYMARIVSLFCLTTNDTYVLIALWFALIAFASQVVLLNQLERWYPSVVVPFALAIFALPTSVFWTSGIIKETLAFSGICLIFAFLVAVWNRESFRWWWLLLIPGCWIIWNLKYYYLAILLPVSFVALGFKFLRWKETTSTWKTLFIWVSVLILPLIVFSNLHPNLNWDRILDVMVLNYKAFIALSQPGDAVIYPHLEPTLKSFFFYAPKALIASCLRPFLWEATAPLQLLSGLENLVVLMLVVVSIRFKRLEPATRILVMALLTYILLLAVLLGLSTPNFGTLVRYRIGFYPFLIALLLCNPIFAPALKRLKVFLG